MTARTQKTRPIYNGPIGPIDRICLDDRPIKTNYEKPVKIKLKTKLNKKPQRWKPLDGEKFFYIAMPVIPFNKETMYVCEAIFGRDMDFSNHVRVGNCFKTYREAKSVMFKLHKTREAIISEAIKSLCLANETGFKHGLDVAVERCKRDTESEEM